MRRTLALTLLVAFAVSGCGSAKKANSTTFVSASAATQGPFSSQPSKLVFSADGDLTAEHLKWFDWGQPVTVGKGLFIFRDSPSNASDAVSGSVTLSQLKRCSGKLYYTDGVVNAQGGPFKPVSPIAFSSGC